MNCALSRKKNPAIATNGEGVSLVNANTGKEILAGLRRPPGVTAEEFVEEFDAINTVHEMAEGGAAV